MAREYIIEDIANSVGLMADEGLLTKEEEALLILLLLTIGDETASYLAISSQAGAFSTGVGMANNSARYLDLYLNSFVSKGMTISEVISAIDDVISSGTLPPMLSQNLSSVARSSVSSYYESRRDGLKDQVEFSGKIKSRIQHNPDDEVSRPTHAALDGKVFAVGSAAERMLGLEPFDHNCRCTHEYSTNDIPESPDAMSLATNLERF